jgi:hypothetical protein
MPCNVVYCNVLYIVPSLKRKWLKIHSFMICSRMLWLQVQCLNHGNPCFFPTWPVSPVSPFLFWGRPEHIWWKSDELCKLTMSLGAGVQPCWITDDFAWIIPTEGEIPTAQNPPRLFFLWSICQFLWSFVTEHNNGSHLSNSMIYPLVNIQITMEQSPFLKGKLTINGHFQ